MIQWQKGLAILTGAACLLVAAGSWADARFDWDFMDDECCEGPLESCCFRVGLRMGASGNFYTDTVHSLAIGTTGSGGVVGTRFIPNFHNQFNIPYCASMHIGFATTEITEIFVEGEYTYADGELVIVSSDTLPEKRDKFHSYEHYSGYLGLRAYLCPWDNCYCPIFPYLGFKGGVVYHECVLFDENTQSLGFEQKDRVYFDGQFVPSVGAQVGFEFEICPCVFLNVMAEAIYTGGMRGNAQVVGGSGGAVETLSIGDTGSIVSFPVTIGLNAIV